MLLRLHLATVSILALMMGAACADSNFANVEQNGADNDGVVVQGPGQFNKLGAEDGISPGAALQNGDNNILTITQSGSRNEVGTSGLGFDQSGKRNSATITQSANRNSVGEVQQIDQTWFGSADRNTLEVTQSGSGNSLGSVRQTRTNTFLANSKAGNSATITQQSNNNSLDDLKQEGFGNTIELTQTGGNGNHVGTLSQKGATNHVTLTFDGARNGTEIFAPVMLDASAFGGLVEANVTQTGIGNSISNFVVSGNRNAFGFNQIGLLKNTIDGGVTGNGNQFGVYQNGSFNSADIEISGNRNEVAVNQDGTFGGLHNDTSAIVTGNANGVGIQQFGAYNDADVKVTGNRNLLAVGQNGIHNGLALNIFGNNNNNPSLPGFTGFTGKAATAALAATALGTALTPGSIVQDGSLNTIEMDVGTAGHNANGNLFAFLQHGDFNGINGSVAGNGNQVVVVQNGNGNFTSFSQTGNFNVIGVNQ